VKKITPSLSSQLKKWGRINNFKNTGEEFVWENRMAIKQKSIWKDNLELQKPTLHRLDAVSVAG
jgi:hypothetical protein